MNLGQKWLTLTHMRIDLHPHSYWHILYYTHLVIVVTQVAKPITPTIAKKNYSLLFFLESEVWGIIFFLESEVWNNKTLYLFTFVCL
jgi:hypothetical protein